MNSLRYSLLLIAFSGWSFAQQAPAIAGCPAFPANNIWNTAIDTMPVDPHSGGYVSSIGSSAGIRYDATMPINVVPGNQPLVRVNLSYPPESDAGPYPIPPNVQIEPASDLHMLLIDKDNCILYETYNTIRQPDGSYNVDSAARWNLRSNALRPDGWTSADGAGLPIAPGVLRYDEMLGGQINHALRITVPATQAYLYQWPARHYASHDTTVTLPMMGQRFRLKASFDISSYPPHIQVVLQAMKKYGLMVADNGLPWSIQADTDPRWDPSELLTLRQVLGSNMEAVVTSGLLVSADSGEATQPGLSTGLSAVSVTQTSAVGGTNISVTVVLSSSAPAGGAAVTLTGSNPALPTLQVLVGAGLASQTFSLPTGAVAASTPVTISASYNGAVVSSSPVTITPPLTNSCLIFPANNIWNTAVNTLPVAASSSAYVNSIGPNAGIRYDVTMPITLVPGTQPKVQINLGDDTESDPGPYPIPPDAQVEPGDRHVIVVDRDNCQLYETYDSYVQPDGSWNVASGSTWNLESNALRPAGWTSGDAAGLPILPGLMRYAEVASGQINHALRFTVPATQRLYVWPARHYASYSTDPSLPPMGQRFRLKAGFDISGFSPNMQVILRALKKYGMMLADNGLPWSLQGDTDPRWDPDDLLTLRAIVGSNWEAVDVSSLMLDSNSGQAAGSPAPSAPVSVASVSLAASSVMGGNSVILTVTLSGAAPAAGAPLSITGSNPAFPAAQAMISPGMAQQTFSLATANVSSATPVTITVAYGGSSAVSPTLTIMPGAPDLTLVVAHTGSFQQGQTGATYRITATNSGAGPVNSTVTVASALPNGLSAVSIAGSGWNCAQPSGPCTRADALASSSSYSAITLTVNVAATAPPTVAFNATVSGGGETNTANDQASDPTTITPTAPTTPPPAATTGNSIWPASAVPANPWYADPSPVTVGVKFRSDVAGLISGVRFYKGAGNNGTHIGLLYDSNGNVLAQAPFASETPSGWQQVNFPSPVSIAANVTYIAAFFTTSGCALDQHFFTNSGVDAPPLHALKSGVDGLNAVYGYGQAPTFPMGTYFDSNYWVDAVFSTSGSSSAPSASLTVSQSHSGAFSPSQTGIFTIAVRNNGAASTSSAIAVTDRLPAGLAAVSMAGAGWTCSQPAGPCTRTDSLAAGASFPSINLTVNVAATAAGSLTNVATVTGGAQSADTVLIAAPAPVATATSIWPASAAPVNEWYADPSPVTLGVKFRSDANGVVNGVRFYKGAGNNGTHIGLLYSVDGKVLAQATFTGESASGWQQVTFSTPVAINANTTYIAAFFTTSGTALDMNYFSTNGVDRGPLHALKSGADGLNAVYGYGPAPTFPMGTFFDSNYWVDVVFTPASS